MILVRAYADLSTCKAIGMQLGPIPITAMWEWCDRQCLGRGLPAAVTNHVVRVLRKVDRVILDRTARKPDEPPRKAER